MTDGVPEKVDELTNPATEPEPEKEPEKVVEEVKEEAPPMPEWAKEMKSTLDSLSETVAGIVAKPEEELEPPGDGHIIDDSPHDKKPWHKRGFFG